VISLTKAVVSGVVLSPRVSGDVFETKVLPSGQSLSTQGVQYASRDRDQRKGKTSGDYGLAESDHPHSFSAGLTQFYHVRKCAKTDIGTWATFSV
jgi:hypothetical protein